MLNSSKVVIGTKWFAIFAFEFHKMSERFWEKDITSSAWGTVHKFNSWRWTSSSNVLGHRGSLIFGVILFVQVVYHKICHAETSNSPIQGEIFCIFISNFTEGNEWINLFIPLKSKSLTHFSTNACQLCIHSMPPPMNFLSV